MPETFTFEDAQPATESFSFEEAQPQEELKSPGFLGPAWPAQEGETIAQADPERERKREELANQMRLRRAERSLSDAIESFLGGAARAVEPLTPAGLMNQPTRIAGAIAGKTIPDIYQAGQPLVNVPQPSGTGLLAGLGQLGAQTLSGLTTPEMVVTAPAFPVSGVARALTAGEMAATLPESISRGGEVLRSPEATVAEKVVAAGQPLVTAAMVKALTKAERILPQAAAAAKEAQKGEITDASEIGKTAEVYGDVRPQPVEGVGQVPVEEGVGGVQPQAEGRLPETVTPPRTAPRQSGVLLEPTAQLPVDINPADVKVGDTIQWEPSAKESRYQSAVSGIVQDVIHNDEGDIGYHIFSPSKDDPTNVVRVWANRGKVVSRTPALVETMAPKKASSAGKPDISEGLRGETSAGRTPQRPKTVVEIADEIAARGIDPQASYGQFVKARDLKPEISAKEWLPIYRKSLELANLNKKIAIAKKSTPPPESTPTVSQAETYRVIDARKTTKAQQYPESVKNRPFEVQSKTETGKFTTIPGALYATEAEAREVIKALSKQKPTPQAEPTPTAIPPAEPSLQTPATQGSISKATTPQQITQAPFLDIPPEKWTPDYWKRIGDEGRRTVRSNLQGALQKLGSKTKITERSTPQAVFNAIAEVNKARIERPIPEPTTIALQAGLGIPGIEKLDRKFNEMRQGLATLMRAGPERRQMDQTFDATDNMANIVARQATNKLRLSGKPIELEAIYPFIEAKGDINQLQHFIAQATGKNDSAVAAARYALSHWNDPHFQALAARAKQISDAQINQEHAAGINTEYREAYLPHSYDRDLLMGFNRPFVIGGSGGGTRTGFKKGRTFETIYDAIEAGYPVKTLNAADTLESRIRSGQKLINRVAWADSFRTVLDPTDGQPIITSTLKHTREEGKPGWESAPSGYVVREIIPGVRVAIHEGGYASLFDALTGTSRISGSVPGKLLLEAEGAVKHGLLLFDTYHVSRVLQKEAFLAGATKMGWRKGLTLLEYSDADLNAALREGFITPEMANFARANRANAELLVRSGLNVGRIQENLYNSVVRQIPVIGKFNKWVFEKMTRGAMLQSALIELERVQRDFGLNRQDAAMKVARDLNVYFGNLGRQGLFKSATAQDLARIVALAPQWVEGMLRTEIGAVTKTITDPIKYRKLAVSSLPLGVGTGLAAYFVATQIVNMVTRGHPTWENPEKGHKMDAWIPDFTGKTGGYFLSPFSVPAEITHDMIRYARTEPDTIATASRILSNKQSPLFRATKTLLTGKDWTGEKLIGSWERAKAASVNLVPAPIGVAPLVTGEKYPGQAQRQITASLGIKTEPAPTAIQQIREIKKEWGLNNPNPKIKHQFEQALKADYGKSDYDDLRRALSADDTKKAGEAYDALIAMGKKPSDINDAVSWYTGGKENASGVYQERKIKPIGGQMSEAAESRFKSSLTPAQRKVYLQAIEERKRIYARFLELLKTR